MPRTVILIDSLAGGGAERQAILLARWLSARRPVSLVAIGARNDYAHECDGLDVTVLGKRSREDLARVLPALRRALGGAEEAVCFGWYPALLASVLKPSCRRVVRFGGEIDDDVPGRWRKRLLSLTIPSADAVVGITPGLLADACSAIGSPARVCAVIPNAVVPSEPARRPEAAPDRYILCAGRLEPVKDHGVVLEGFARIAERVPHDLVIAGDGSLRDDLRAQVTGLGIADRVRFVGFVEDLPDWMAAADLTVLASRFEGFGSVLIESMAVGTPVVASDVDHGPRYIFSRVPAGRLFRPGDPASLATHVLALLSDDALRADLGSLGRTGVAAEWSVERMGRRYLDMLEAASAMPAGTWEVAA